MSKTTRYFWIGVLVGILLVGLAFFYQYNYINSDKKSFSAIHNYYFNVSIETKIELVVENSTNKIINSQIGIVGNNGILENVSFHKV